MGEICKFNHFFWLFVTHSFTNLGMIMKFVNKTISDFIKLLLTFKTLRFSRNSKIKFCGLTFEQCSIPFVLVLAKNKVRLRYEFQADHYKQNYDFDKRAEWHFGQNDTLASDPLARDTFANSRSSASNLQTQSLEFPTIGQINIWNKMHTKNLFLMNDQIFTLNCSNWNLNLERTLPCSNLIWHISE